MKKIFVFFILSYHSILIIKMLLVLIMTFIVCTHYSLAQTIKVLDKTTLQPIPSVTILANNGMTGTITNAMGEAEISAFKNSDSILFSFIGYQPKVLSYSQVESKKFTVLLSEKSYSLGELVVSASRFEEKKEDVPQQIQVMKSRDLQFMSQQTTADVMQQSGNILVQKSQAGGGSPIIRGFEANKVLIVVDGVRMNNAIYRGGHLQNILTIDNSVLEKTEIVFGPGSVVYGSDALGGVLHFYTKNPILSYDTAKNKIHANVFTRYSSANNEKTGHFDFNIRLQKLGFLTGFTYSGFSDLASGKNQDDIYDKLWKRTFYVGRIDGKDSVITNPETNIQKPSGYSQYDFFEKILFQQNSKTSHILNLQYSNSSDITRYDRLSELSGLSSGTSVKGDSNPKFAEWYYGPQKKFFSSYTLNLKTNSPLQDGPARAGSFSDNMRIIIAYQDIGESRHDRKFQKDILNNRIEKLDIVTLNVDFDKKIKKNEFRYGAEATYNKVNSSAFSENINTGEKFLLDTRYPDGGSSMQTIAAYITHTLEITPKFIITNGARYSNVMLRAKFNDTTFFPFPFNEVVQKNGALNGNLGLILMPGKEWRFSMLGSTGFRAPNIDDLSKVFESIPGKVIVPNPELKSEKTYNGEISLSKGFNEAVKLEATGYITRYKNIITSGKAQFNGKDSIIYNGTLSEVLSNFNKATAYIYGTSWNFIADITNSFSVASSLNFTYGRIETDSTDSPLDHIPPVFGKTSFNLKLNKFRGEFFILYNGAKKLKDYNLYGEDNFAYATPAGMPSWHTLNTRASIQFTKNIQLQLACENILDRHYRVFASGISGGGRNFIVTLRGNI